MALTRAEIASLGEQIRRTRGRCLQRGEVLEKWLAVNPDTDIFAARRFATSVGRSPFPPIDGPHPKYPHRPFFDARFETVWKNDNP